MNPTPAPTAPSAPPNLLFARTLVDEWVRAGITDAVVSPGSRSTPLAVAVTERLRTQVILDERAASYTALGLASATDRAVVLVCTSGTAAAGYHAAVVEASQGCVPLIVCTADRPPELQQLGAPQTIDQVGLYAAAVRWATSPGPPDVATSYAWRALASRAVHKASSPSPGPVHLNLAFREPLLTFTDDDLPAGRRDGGPWQRRPASPRPAPPPAEIAEWCAQARRPLVVGGHLAADGMHTDGVPILTDHRGPLTGTVAHWDLLLRDADFAAAHRPDLIVRTGMAPASKALSRWLAAQPVPQIAIMPPGRWIDPDHTASFVSDRPLEVSLSGESGWARSWTEAGARAARVIDDVLASHTRVTEPGTARHTLATRAPGSVLVVSSSMPVRDLESFAHPRPDVRVLANRGANGIDGVTSTALGVALSGVATTLLTGDLAFLHDVGALNGIARRDVDLTIVVVDNAGGGIFSFLPQHDVLDPAAFDQLFGTPQHVDLPALCAAHNLAATEVSTASELTAAFETAHAQTGVRVVLVDTDRGHNLTVHDELVAAVADTTH